VDKKRALEQQYQDQLLDDFMCVAPAHLVDQADGQPKELTDKQLKQLLEDDQPDMSETNKSEDKKSEDKKVSEELLRIETELMDDKTVSDGEKGDAPKITNEERKITNGELEITNEELERLLGLVDPGSSPP
jgi:hypothetical protein